MPKAIFDFRNFALEHLSATLNHKNDPKNEFLGVDIPK